MIDRGLRVAQWVSLRAVWAGGILLFLAAFTVSVDVLARKLFSVSLGGSDELSGYAFAIGTTWAFAFALLHRANVRVDALYQVLPIKLRALLDVLALVALGVFAAYLSRFAYEVLITSWSLGSRSNSALQVPLWIPQSLWAAGLGLFLVTLTLLLAKSISALVRADWATIHAQLGARSTLEEAAEEGAYADRLAARHRDSGGTPR